MKPLRSMLLDLAAVLIFCSQLISCGGGGGGGSVPIIITPPTHFGLSGNVSSGGAGLPGVALVLSGAGSATAFSDASGNFSFSGLANGSYTITPSKGGFDFTPASSIQVVNGANVSGVAFTAVPNNAPTFSLSGTVTSGGAGLPGVTMTLNGAGLSTAVTDASGNYTFTGLIDGSYTVTPTKSGLSFTPASSPRTISGSDITGVNFTAPVPTFTISGTVTSGGAPLAGVTMGLSGAATASVTTDASGRFSFSGLANGTYTVTPARTGFTFAPASSALTVNGANISGVDFSASQTQVQTFSISGTVTSGGAGVAGITMTLGGAGSASAATDASGNFTFSGLANGSYTVTPASAGFVFTPANSSVNVNNQNVSAVNFTAASTLAAQVVPCPATGTTNVTMSGSTFIPGVVNIAPNGIVKWTNSDGIVHTVTSGLSPVTDGKFDTGTFASGSVCIQFLAAGSYPYFSTTDIFMTGTVTVQ